MTAMPPMRDILNNTPADAVDVDYNFKNIQSHIANELINRDGSVAMTGPITVPPPTAPNHAASKAYVDAATPVGVINPYAGATAPTGWALCDGSSKTTTDPLYAALFAVIGYTYGGSSGSFNLPNLQGRFPVGKGTTAPFTALNTPGGTKDAIVVGHSHIVQAHQHDLSNHQHVGRHTHGLIGTGNQSANHVHNVMAPGWFAHGQNGTVGHTAVPAGTGNTFLEFNNAPGTTNNLSDHTHNINIPESTALTDGPNTNTSGYASPATDTQGSAGTNQNLPPYVVLNYIIRIGIP